MKCLSDIHGSYLKISNGLVSQKFLKIVQQRINMVSLNMMGKYSLFCLRDEVSALLVDLFLILRNMGFSCAIASSAGNKQ